LLESLGDLACKQNILINNVATQASHDLVQYESEVCNLTCNSWIVYVHLSICMGAEYVSHTHTNTNLHIKYV